MPLKFDGLRIAAAVMSTASVLLAIGAGAGS